MTLRAQRAGRPGAALERGRRNLSLCRSIAPARHAAHRGARVAGLDAQARHCGGRAGVADIVSFGGHGQGISGEARSVSAAQVHGITVDQVGRRRWRTNSANAGGGLLRRGDEALVIRSIGLCSRIEDIAAGRGGARGGRANPGRRSGARGNRRASARGHGRIQRPRTTWCRAIVQMTKGQNATKVVEDLKIEIARAAAAPAARSQHHAVLRSHRPRQAHGAHGHRKSGHRRGPGGGDPRCCSCATGTPRSLSRR